MSYDPWIKAFGIELRKASRKEPFDLNKMDKLLTENNADIDHKFHNDFTFLMLAVTEGIAEIVELLIRHKANVNSVSNDRKFTPLIIAINKSNEQHPF